MLLKKRYIYKWFVFILCGILLVSTISNINVSAQDNYIFQNELSDSIISGDGSEESPYIIDPSKAPNFYDYLVESGKEALSSIQNPNNGIAACGVLSGVLSGWDHEGETDGAYWIYTSGAPSVNNNGNLWMKKVEYLGYDDVVNKVLGFSDSNFVSSFQADIIEFTGLSLTAATNLLVKKGCVSQAAAKSIAKWIGAGSTYITIGLLAAEFSTFFQNKPYIDAKNRKVGLIHAEYCTSYQGAWYAVSLSEPWDYYPIAYEPGSAYGTGKYVTRT